ncbi:1-acyl-sn-glycerol-3-phosphate acyltransferase [Flavobacteriaceae bacterium]|mgnify:CR=1 FL=1|nr:1-acyl-sn-glycerol-3-phosphate acyltransferase [Flavobacteriaceae bacterium]
MGWSIEGTIDPKVKHAVIIVVPHTSSFDFILGLLIRSILGLHINYLGKKELFIWPFKYYFRWTGGRPLDRTGGQNKVAAIAQLFRGEKVFRLALSPEGTRKKVKDWRTGFYYIAMEANVPVLPIALFYRQKCIRIGPPMAVSGKIDEDLPKIQSFFKGANGKIPEYSWEHED